MSHFLNLQNDLNAKFGSNVFKFSTTPVGDHVIDPNKESVPALLTY